MKLKLIPSIIFMSKLFFGLLFIQTVFLSTLFASNGNGQDMLNAQEVFISVELKQASLIEVFNQIQSKSEFTFSYEKQDLDTNVKIDLMSDKVSVAEILKEVSRVAKLTFRQVNNNINVRKMKAGSKQSFNMEVMPAAIPVTGLVTSSFDGEPLPGVTILIKGTSIGTVTDINGNYNISVPNENDTLVFSFVGFTTQEIPVNGRGTIDVTLEEDVESLEEVVVVGYGTVQKKDLTGAVGVVSGEVAENQAVSSVAQTLQGRVAGLNIRQTNGGPGSGAEISIRGMGTFGANSSPLVVIDGIITNGGLADVDPNSIETVTVLKDATSAAIYGSRGANGVLLITTKRGKAGKEVISFQADHPFVRCTQLHKALLLPSSGQ